MEPNTNPYAGQPKADRSLNGAGDSRKNPPTQVRLSVKRHSSGDRNNIGSSNVADAPVKKRD
jgi:hypothetical protein